MKTTLPRKPPKVGDIIEVRGQRCRVFKVREFGTVDVESLDTDSAYRVTGLGFSTEETSR